jgi:hypothetical protein
MDGTWLRGGFGEMQFEFKFPNPRHSPICSRACPLLEADDTTAAQCRLGLDESSNGERVGNIQFGYRLALDGVHIEPDPSEQAALAAIRRLRSDGIACAPLPALSTRAATAPDAALSGDSNPLCGQSTRTPRRGSSRWRDFQRRARTLLGNASPSISPVWALHVKAR